MCILITTQNLQNHQITKEQFQNCWDNNPDGFGIAYVAKGKIIIEKELDKIGKAYSIYLHAIKKNPSSSAIIHFRIGTHGGKTLDNCHPFEVDKNLVFAHNGIIPIQIPKDLSDLSDTRYYNEIILKGLVKDFGANCIDYQSIQNTIILSIGQSKLAFLDVLGKITIINENLGTWDKSKGMWYSNTSYSYSYNRYNYADELDFDYPKSWHTSKEYTYNYDNDFSDDDFYGDIGKATPKEKEKEKEKDLYYPNEYGIAKDITAIEKSHLGIRAQMFEFYILILEYPITYSDKYGYYLDGSFFPYTDLDNIPKKDILALAKIKEKLDNYFSAYPLEKLDFEDSAEKERYYNDK